MIKNTLCFVLMLFAINAYAQFDNTCEDAGSNSTCDIDDINGAIIMNPPPGGSVPGDPLCMGGGAFHNTQWFSFVAGDTELTIDLSPTMCDTTGGGFTGIQAAIWSGCPGGGGECIAGDANCNDMPFTLTADNFEIGQIYNLVIDGCGGSICTVTVTDVVPGSNWGFDIPDCSEANVIGPLWENPFLCPPDFLPDNTFCIGRPFRFLVEGGSGPALDEIFAQWEYSLTGPDPGSVTWENLDGNFGGTGDDILVGDISANTLSDSQIEMTFTEPGTYELCIDAYETKCSDDDGGCPQCVEFEIVSSDPQDFGVYDLCYLDLVQNPFTPPGTDLTGQYNWADASGEITLADVLADGGMIERAQEDPDCQCFISQLVHINLLGDGEPEEVTLTLFSCQAPYQFNCEEISDLEAYSTGDQVYCSGFSLQEDYTGTNCDSIMNLTIIQIFIEDEFNLGPCGPNGTEVFVDFQTSEGEDFDYNSAIFQWFNQDGDFVTSLEDPTLPEGIYTLQIEGLVEDENGMLISCNLNLGPYTVTPGGTAAEAEAKPYPNPVCNQNLTGLQFVADTVAGITYEWLVPDNWTTTFESPTSDSIVINIDTYVPTDTLFLTAAGDCGIDTTALPLEVTSGPMNTVNGADDACTGVEYATGYDGTAVGLMYNWTVNGGMMTSGMANSQNIGITYPNTGSFSYTLLITDAGGCTSEATYNVIVDEGLPAPQVTCANTTNSITFSWPDVPGATGYIINTPGLPAGAVTNEVGNTLEVTNLSPGDNVSIEVTAQGGGNCINEIGTLMCSAGSCNSLVFNNLVCATQGVDFVEFTWDAVVGASMFEVFINTVSQGMSANTSFTQSGLAPGENVDIIVIAINDDLNCPNVQLDEACSALDCNLGTPDVINFDDFEICSEDVNTVQFDILPPAGSTGTYSGNGVDPTTGLWDPTDPSVVLGPNVITYNYGDTNCSGQPIQITINVLEQPRVDLMLSLPSICLGETITVTGVTGALITTWNFGAVGDFMGNENGLTYLTPGVKTIEVLAENGVCTADGTITINVLPAIEGPIEITCVSGTTSVQFMWNEIEGAASYDLSVSVNGGTPVTSNVTDEVLIEDGLNQGDQVVITVTAVSSNGCGGNVSATDMCEAVDCGNPVIDIMASQFSFCTNDQVGAVNLSAVVDGASTTGEFSGTGVDNIGVNYIFNPEGLAPDDYIISFSYTDPNNGCLQMGQTVFSVIEAFIPDITADALEICVDETVIITSAGLPGNGAQSWNFGGGNVISETPTEVELGWDNGGSFDVTLTFDNDACPDEQAPITIIVNDTLETPRILCENSGTDFVLFGWNDQGAGSVEYEIYIDGNLETTTTDTGFLLDGLNSGEEPTITVIALDPLCGNKTAMRQCIAQPCIPPIWDLPNQPDQCFEVGVSDPVELMISAEPADPTTSPGGSISWLEPSVDGNNGFVPDNGSGVYTFTAIWTEGNCTTDTTVSVQVNILPDFNLSVSSDRICSGESIMVSADYNDAPNAFFDWDFGGGTPMGATDNAGPIEVVFDDTQSGYMISLSIDNGTNCVSDVMDIAVQVDSEITPPVITCGNNTLSSVEVMWDAVDCAAEYIVYVNGNAVSTQAGTSYEVIGLGVEETVSIEVEVVSDCACPGVRSAAVDCASRPCDAPGGFTFSSALDNDICLDGTVAPFQITGTPNGLPGNGTGTWSGEPISDPAGTVDPSLVSAGTYDLLFAYTEGVCSYPAETVEITFVAPPSIDIVDIIDPPCPNDVEGIVNVEGLGGSPGYMYAIDGGTMQASGVFSGVSIGTHIISIADANGCINELPVVVDAPPIASVTITGPNTVISENDATYELNLDGISLADVDNIVWYADSTVVCDSPTCTSYTITNASNDTELSVEITYNGNCVIVDALSVDVRKIQAFYVPDIISNNIEGTNSEWRVFIKGDETFPVAVNVYNRWGNLVHSQEWPVDEANPPEGPQGVLLWDGFYGVNGPALKTEVYVYVLEMRVEGQERIQHGNITVIR